MKTNLIRRPVLFMTLAVALIGIAAVLFLFIRSNTLPPPSGRLMPGEPETFTQMGISFIEYDPEVSSFGSFDEYVEHMARVSYMGYLIVDDNKISERINTQIDDDELRERLKKVVEDKLYFRSFDVDGNMVYAIDAQTAEQLVA